MTIGTSLRNAARNLINTFGNTASVYTYSSSTKSENPEGDVTVSSWGTAASIKIIDGPNLVSSLNSSEQGFEVIGEDEKVIRDDATVAINDRVTVNSIEFRVIEIKPVRIIDTLVIQSITLTRVTGITAW